jgi:hypothetical protein
MEFSNELTNQQTARQEQRWREEDFRHPFKICCVLFHDVLSQTPRFNEVRDFCDANNITLYSRDYNPEKYEEDVLIFRLPAFLIYDTKSVAQRTVHYDEFPVEKIKAHLDRHVAAARAKREREADWESAMNKMKNLFVFSFKKKTKLEHARPQRRKTATAKVGVELT